MSAEIIRECVSCPTPREQVFSSQVVIEDEFSLVPGIPRPEKVKIKPLFDTFKVELVCGDVVVVCGIIRKIIVLPECVCRKPIIHDFAFQATIPVSIDSQVPVSPCDIKVTGVEVCTGCFKLLDPTREGCKEIFHKIREKDIIRIQVTFTMPEDCKSNKHKDYEEHEEHDEYDDCKKRKHNKWNNEYDEE
jgi:hypothetical protein